MSDFQNPGAKSIAMWKKADGHGAFEWLKERFSSLALLPLLAWALFSVTLLAGRGFDAVKAYLQVPANSSILGLLILISLWHGHMGLKVVIEDYFPTGSMHKVFMSISFLLMILLLVVTCLSLYLLIWSA